MQPLRIDLDSGARHYLLLTLTNGSVTELSLHHSSADRRSLLHDAFRRHLRVQFDAAPSTFLPDTDCLAAPEGARRLVIELGRMEPMMLACVDLEGTPAITGSRYILSPFESRFLADNGFPHPAPPEIGATVNLRTDLHVHFGGCVSAEDLIRIGVQCRVSYPTGFLAESGIHIDAAADVALADLPAEFLQQLQARLSIPLDHQATFSEMEKIYRLRSPITKSPEAFIPLCRQIAADYRAMGVSYVELSLFDVVSADRLRSLHRELPALEREFGVKLRFLAAMWRHDDLEWDLDYIERIKAVAGSRYIVGADFMGHETNSTRAFARQIRDVAEWADGARPGFVVRVHAGENPAHPENVRVAVESVAECRVQLRIGHGLFGVDDATLDQLAAIGAMVEFNLNSNFALNNIQDANGVPILRYIRRGIPVVLGTDGYGIYQTTPALEARAARLCGLADADFAHIRASEDEYLLKRAAADAHLPEPAALDIPDDRAPVHYTPEVIARKRQATRQRDQALLDRLAALRVPLLDAAALSALARGKRCISFAGAWKESWQTISPEYQALIRQEIGTLLRALVPGNTLLITGGTCYGVEKVVQEIAMPLGFDILGTLVNETPIDSLKPGAITHAYLVAQTLYDKAAGLYRLMKDYEGLCLFIGGGSIVNDEIQTAGNLRLRYLLMDGPQGASTLQARQQPSRAFRTADDVLKVLSESGWKSDSEPYWHLGANPTVDIVLTRHEPHTGRRQVLLIQRDVDAPTEGGKWALPGGFQLTNAPRGTPWIRDVERARDACVRELLEETGLDLRDMAGQLIHVGDYEGNGRDPRDTPAAWSRSEVFALHLPDARASAPLCGADDACDARWFDVHDLPVNLAFDHAKILVDGLARLREQTTVA